MDRRVLFLGGLVIGAVGVTSVLIAKSSVSGCITVDPWGLRFDSMAYSVVIPTSDTIEVGSRGAVDVPLGFWKSLEEIILGSPVHGQLANLVRYDGPWADRLKEQNEDVLIVPWDIGESPSCVLIPWTRSYR
jgi:hypothetical protein